VDGGGRGGIALVLLSRPAGAGGHSAPAGGKSPGAMGPPLTSFSLFIWAYAVQATVSCLRLLRHTTRLPCSRALVIAGNSMAISSAMMAMTTSNSMSENALCLVIANYYYKEEQGGLTYPCNLLPFVFSRRAGERETNPPVSLGLNSLILLLKRAEQ
jgi:hypothetical protein